MGRRKVPRRARRLLGLRASDSPAAPANPIDRDHIGLHKQKDGNYYLGVKPTLGHLSGEQLIAVADLAESHRP